MSLEWGVAGALAAPEDATTFVVVDILSFSTAVTLAVARGTEVVPCGDGRTARRLAGEVFGTALAVNRLSVDLAHPWSLSPAHLSRAPFTPRLVLASPNGATVAAALAAAGKLVVACSLRNVTAVGRWLLGQGPRLDSPLAELELEEPSPVAEGTPPRAHRRLVVVAAGERWPDGSLRPALEDCLGAARLLQVLRDGSPPVRLSPAAALAARSVSGMSPLEIAGLVRGSVSAAELQSAGYEEDVEMAVRTDADAVVPVLRPARRGAPAAGFRPASPPVPGTTSGL